MEGEAAAGGIQGPQKDHQDDCGQPGGGRHVDFDHRNTQAAPAHVRQHQLQGVSAEYKQAAFADGIPYRPNGLFPPNDPLLARLASDPRLHPFEKHLPGEVSAYELLPKGGWATGDAAAKKGMDLRLFFKDPEPGEQFGTICGAVRFGDGACIGNGFYMSAHGGSIETALDEATAELAKLEFVPMVSTREASFSITKTVPLHTSLLITCRIKETRGLRCYVEGAILAASAVEQELDGSSSRGSSGNGSSSAGFNVNGNIGRGDTYAKCTALLVNIRDWI